MTCFQCYCTPQKSQILFFKIAGKISCCHIQYFCLHMVHQLALPLSQWLGLSFWCPSRYSCLTIFSYETCDALRDSVPFVQFNKGEKHQWRSFTFSKSATLLIKVTLLHGRFLRFLNRRDRAKSRNASHMGIFKRYHNF